MKNLKRRLYLISIMVLLVGLGSALGLYLTVQEDQNGMLVQQFESSKMYRHNLELVGGQMSVVMDSFCRWLDGLWKGKSLAKTVAWLTLVVSSVLIFIGGRLPSDP